MAWHVARPVSEFGGVDGAATATYGARRGAGPTVNGYREELTRLSVDCDLELCLGFGSENGQGGCVAHPQRGSALPVLLPALETLHCLQS